MRVTENPSLGIGNVDDLLTDLFCGESWTKLLDSYKKAKYIIFVGHGGNLAIADHIAVDTSRLTKGEKITFSPGSVIHATSHINDSSFEEWLVSWFKSFEKMLEFESTLLIGISSSGRSKDTLKLIKYADSVGVNTSLITAKESLNLPSKCNILNTNCDTYHKSEVVALAIGYQLIVSAGWVSPRIS